MDRFVAAISPHQDLGSEIPKLLQQALQVITLKSEVASPTESWCDHHFALACIRSGDHSDTAVYFPPTSNPASSTPLIYQNGPLRWGVSQTPPDNAGIPVESSYSDRLTAVVSLFDGSSGFKQAQLAPGFEKLSGSFHAIVYQPEMGRSWVMVDRMASRTLFYCRTGDLVLVASDIRVLLALPQVSTALDMEGLCQFVRYQMILGPGTLYKQIKTVPGGHFLAISPDQIDFTPQAYWTMQPLPYYATREEAVETVSQSFVDATRRNLADSPQPGLLLSGGMDSRMLLASLDAETNARLRTYTFGDAQTYETLISRQVAQTLNLPWKFITQDQDIYWHGLGEAVALSNGLNSLAHVHLRYPASQMAAEGCDTILHGWAMDAFHSGSYLPKRSYKILGRTLTDYGLTPLKDQHAVAAYLHKSLDMQRGIFENSLFGSAWRTEWQIFPKKVVETQVANVAGQSPVPYDWIDYVLFGHEVARFRSTAMMTSLRTFARERSPLFENEVIESYLRLPYKWRFLGPIFRRGVARLNPALVKIPYSNLGISPLAPAFLQALSIQGGAFWRANKARLSTLLEKLKLRKKLSEEGRYGNYLSACEMVGYLTGGGEQAKHVLQLLERGPLAEVGLFDPARLQPALQRAARGDESTGFTLMAWVSLALWFDTQPFELS